MVKRAAKCYGPLKGHAYTRTSQKKQRKSYIKGVPGPQIHVFDMGALKKEFTIRIDLVAAEAKRIRHGSIEAGRISANKYLDKNVGLENYYFKIRIYPHEVLREHAMVTGAGADRISSGMARAFGRPCGTAATVHAKTRVMSIYVEKKYLEPAKEALRAAGMKLPMHYYLEVNDIQPKG
jgi:large subunit ribosomal protein L10e